MTCFTENPTPPVVLGTLIAALLAFVLFKTGSRPALWALIGTAVATIAVVVANVLIVTPREEVTATLEEIRQQMQANKPPELIKYIDPGAIELRNRAQYDLQSLTVESAKINDLKILIGESGTSAKAEFIGVVDFANSGGRLPYTHFVLSFKVDLRKVDGRWLVTGAEYRGYNPTGAGGEAAVPPRPNAA
jgi:hypothetical protein